MQHGLLPIAFEGTLPHPSSTAGMGAEMGPEHVSSLIETRKLHNRPFASFFLRLMVPSYFNLSERKEL